MRLLDFAVGIVAILACTAAFGGSSTEPGVPFVENRRQWPSTFLFGADFNDARVYLDPKRIFFIQFTRRSDGKKGPPDLPTDFNEVDHNHQTYSAWATFEMEFLGSSTPTIKSIGQHVTLYNYYLGNDSTKWASGARAFDAVKYSALYQGIDLVVSSQNGLMKSDWIVSPCADPSQILLRYNGIEDIALINGQLHVSGRLGDVIEERPVAYQYVQGYKKNVACEYVLNDQTISFQFPEGYDPNYELVIDPILIFSSYSGSSSDNWGNTATPDRYGNLYSGGIVKNDLNPTGFPVSAGAFQTVHKGDEWDVGILKYDSVGSNLLYVTLLGGSGVETPQSLVVNNDDELLVLGATSSSNFPGTTPGTFRGGQTVSPLAGITYGNGSDIFIVKLSSTGTQLLAGRYLGGTNNDGINIISASSFSPLARNYGDELRGDITIDSENNVFIASSTRSSNFPVVNPDPGALFHGGSHDGVVVKLNSDLSTVLWSRLIGGGGTDIAYSIKIGKQGRIYVAGGTNSVNMALNGYIKAARGNIDGWIVELSADGSAILNGTFLGTTSYDQIYFIDIGTEGDVFAYGQTNGNYPIDPIGKIFSNPGGGQFLHKLNADLTTSIFSTAFGSGPGPDISPTAFLVNDCDNIYMAGWGGSINGPSRSPNYVGGNTTNMPITPDAFQPVTVQGNDFYMIVLSGNVELVYATYLGGTTSPTHVDGGTSRFDKRGIVYHAVCASCFGNNDFPAVNVPHIRSSNRSPNCNNAAFKFDLSSLKAKVRTNNLQLSAAGLSRVCIPDPIVFENTSIGGELFKWDMGDGTKVLKTEHDTIRHFYHQPGTYIVKLTAIDASTCIGIDSTALVVTVALADMKAAEDRSICYGSSTRLDAEGALVYEWKGASTDFTSKERSPLVSPGESESYFLTMTHSSGCQRKDTIDVRVVPRIELQFDVEMVHDCVERPYLTVTDKTELKEDEETFINFGDGTAGQGPEVVHSYPEDGVYTITLVGRKEDCVYESSSQVPVVTVRVPNVITPADSPDKNDVFKVLAGNSGAYRDFITISLSVFNRWGKRVYTNSNYKDDWNANDLEEGVYYYEVDIIGQTQCKGWLHVIK